MAAVPVTIVGILTTGDGNSQNATLVGMASLTGLSVGGGPIIPPVGDRPPGAPAFPIVLPPGSWPPGGGPPGPGYPPSAEHPIVIPPPPTEPPPDGGGGSPPASIVKPPPPEGGWAFSPEHGWGYFPGPGQPTPKG